jgi:arylsulfatase B
MQEDPATAARVAGIADPRRRVYASMLLSMDDAVGEVLGALDRLKLAERTLVFFVSDNGGPTERTTARNTPLRGKKGELYEGGLRVPFAIRWPGHIEPGTVYRQPVSALDIAPTALAAAGATIAPGAFDGVDLVPFVTGQRGNLQPHERLYWRQGSRWAVREGRFKLVHGSLFGRSVLFDLEADVGETKRAQKQGAVRKRLEAAYEAWNDQMARPRDQLPGILGTLQQWWRSKDFMD